MIAQRCKYITEARTCVACKFAKHDHTLLMVIYHELIVNEADIIVQNRLQHWHVIQLAFVRVGEE
jgi:DNA-directed RNA polymerase subunit L